MTYWSIVSREQSWKSRSGFRTLWELKYGQMILNGCRDCSGSLNEMHGAIVLEKRYDYQIEMAMCINTHAVKYILRFLLPASSIYC